MTDPAQDVAQIMERLHALEEDLDRPSGEDTQEEFIDQAAEGTYGDTWRTVGRRILDGETTMQAVFDGDDESPEARELRDRASDRADQLTAHWQETEDEDLAELQSAALGEREKFLERTRALQDWRP